MKKRATLATDPAYCNDGTGLAAPNENSPSSLVDEKPDRCGQIGQAQHTGEQETPNNPCAAGGQEAEELAIPRVCPFELGGA